MATKVTAKFDTDDDAELLFEGESYCFYNHDLIIERTFGTPIECYALLRSITMKEHKGGMLEMFNEFVEDAISKHYLQGDGWSSMSGNQQYEINFYDVEA